MPHPCMSDSVPFISITTIICNQSTYLHVEQVNQSSSVFCYPHLQCVEGIKLSVHLQKILNVTCLNIKCLISVLYSSEYRSKRICNSLHSIFGTEVVYTLTFLLAHPKAAVFNLHPWLCSQKQSQLHHKFHW